MKSGLLLLSAASIISALASSCTDHKSNTASTTPDSLNHSYSLPDSANFKTNIDGNRVSLYMLTNKNNVTVAITNFGGRLVSLLVPDKNGNPTDIILGHDSIDQYQPKKENYFGAIIGRYGNRIGKGMFSLNNIAYQLDRNDGVNTLHGGFSGFYKKVFVAKQISKTQLQLTYISKDGDGGYPGNLSVKVIYTLTDDNALKIEYHATTDKPTIVNLTNHAYFNLNGEGTATITNDSLKINADFITPVDTTLIPTGKMMAVKGTPFDFTTLKTIGRDIANPDAQLKNGKGYDHNFVLNKHTTDQPVATLKSPVTGIVMDVYTDQPGLQFYSGNFLNGEKDGKKGATYAYRSALCLETQHFPDSPNEPSFPTTVLNPGQTYYTVTTYKFSVEK